MSSVAKATDREAGGDTFSFYGGRAVLKKRMYGTAPSFKRIDGTDPSFVVNFPSTFGTA